MNTSIRLPRTSIDNAQGFVFLVACHTTYLKYSTVYDSRQFCSITKQAGRAGQAALNSSLEAIYSYFQTSVVS